MELFAAGRDPARGNPAPTAGRHPAYRISAIPPDIVVPEPPEPDAQAGERAAEDSTVTRKTRPQKQPGKAARALKDLREKANVTEADASVREGRPALPLLSQRRMAEEMGWVGPDGRPKTSKYQWYEDECPKDFLPLDIVKAVMAPLVMRGIAEDEVKGRLLGEVSVRVVASPRPVRRAPVFARDAVRLIATGEIDPTGVGNPETFPAETLRRWESLRVVVGWENLPDDDPRGNTVLFEVDEGRVAVDLSSRRLREGRSYVLATGPERDAFHYAKMTGGALLDAEAPWLMSTVPFDRGRDYVVGRVVLFLRRL